MVAASRRVDGSGDILGAAFSGIVRSAAKDYGVELEALMLGAVGIWLMACGGNAVTPQRMRKCAGCMHPGLDAGRPGAVPVDDTDR